MTVVEGRSDGERRVTIREAATLLDVHPNTVRNRIHRGEIKAEMVLTERGPTWMIDPDSLTTNAPPSSSQQLVGRVPEEALTILAREIVREAGMHPDPEREARLEASKLRAEAAKTQVLLSSGSLVGMAAVVGVLPTSNKLDFLFIAVLFICLSVVASFRYMALVAEAVVAQSAPTSPGWQAGPVSLGLGLLIFGYFVLYNIPFNTDLGPLHMTKDQFLVFSVIAALLTVGLFYAVRTVWLRRRSNLQPPQ